MTWCWSDTATKKVRTEGGGYKLPSFPAEVFWRYLELATGHDAMITEPERLSRLFLELGTPMSDELGRRVVV